MTMEQDQEQMQGALYVAVDDGNKIIAMERSRRGDEGFRALLDEFTDYAANCGAIPSVLFFDIRTTDAALLPRIEAAEHNYLLDPSTVTEKLGLDIKDCTFAVQGFGNVGSTAAYLIADLGAKVVAVSDHTAAFYCADGLDVHDMLDYAAGNGRVLQGYKADGVTEIAKEDLLYTDADFLIPAALEGQITADNADRVKAKYIVEGANGPTSYEADQILNAKGKIVVPDILANAGGVIVSYFEWVQNLQSLSWSLEEVNNKLADILLKAFDEVYGLTEERGYPMRTSAYIIALRRLVKTKKIRGIFP